MDIVFNITLRRKKKTEQNTKVTPPLLKRKFEVEYTIDFIFLYRTNSYYLLCDVLFLIVKSLHIILWKYKE